MVSNGKTPIKTLQARLYLDIRDNKDSIFMQVTKSPSTFYLKDKEIIIEDNEEQEEPSRFTERDLHRLLSSYVYVSPDF